MNVFQSILASGFLMGAAACVQAAPHWSAAIGTGTAADGPAAVVAPSMPAPAATSAASSIPVPWSALIGTGQVSEWTYPRTEVGAPMKSARSYPNAAHWSAAIGTGHVSDTSHPG